jgi:hypothetical protein
MSIFNAFNKLNNSISNSFGNIRQTAQTINSFTANIGRVQSQFQSFTGGNNGITRGFGEISDTVNNVRNTLGLVDNLISGGSSSTGNIGTAVRMIGNVAQDVGFNAAPRSRNISRATISKDISSADASDWRVSLSVPGIIMEAAGATMEPLADTGNRMIFPFTPTILLSHSANYSTIQPTHTNYAYHAYENSQVDNITLTGEFIQENAADARYWLAALHYLRTMTKMFYGESDAPLGNPPPIARLNGYGKYVLNNIPVVITNFTTDLPQDVDYIECEFAGETNYVPTQCVFTVTVAPNYARRSQARFSLQDYAAGRHTQGNEGFV